MTERAVFANSMREARSQAEKIARKEGISGTLTIEELPYMGGGTYYLCRWS